MSMDVRFITAACAFGLFTVPVFAQEPLTALSTWENTRGSILTIEAIDSATGALTGSYVNNAAGYGCQGTEYPATGWVYDDEISFSVRWANASADCKSITAWAGYYANGRILTDWNLVAIDPATGQPDITQGSDTFYPKTSATTGAPAAD